MPKFGDLMLHGRSGARHCFQTWSFATRFRAQAAVFVVTRRSFTNETYHRANHEVIYIGQADSMAAPLGTTALLDALDKHGANCIGVRAVANADARASIVEDLLAVQRPAIHA